MKRILSFVLAAVLLCGCVFALASCGSKKLSGKYKADVGLYTITYEFKGNEFTCVRTTVAASISHTASGTYEITEDEDGNMFIAFTYGEGSDESAKEDSVKLTFAEVKENDVEYIKINGLPYRAID